MQTEHKIKILVVENEPLIARDLKMSLERLGYEVSAVVATYQDALSKAHQARPDLALMDINIDGNKDGIQTAKALKLHYDIPIIFLTSLRELETVQKAKESDPFGYLVKPFRADDLQTSIEIALHNHQKTAKLQGNLDKLSNAMHMLETAIIILDSDGIIDYYNSRVEDITSWRRSDKLGHSINYLLSIENTPAWLYLETFSEKERVQNAIHFSENAFLVNRAGEQLPVMGHVSSFHSADGDVAGYLIVLNIRDAEKKGVVEKDTSLQTITNHIVDNYIFLKDKSSLYRIHLDQITYVEALGNYVKVHTPAKAYTALIPLKDIESMLPVHKFFRNHRSYIVAVDKITAIHNTDLQIGEAMLPIGKTYRDELLKRIKVI